VVWSRGYVTTRMAHQITAASVERTALGGIAGQVGERAGDRIQDVLTIADLPVRGRELLPGSQVVLVIPPSKVTVVDSDTVACVVDGLPRFVNHDDYADSFGWQWNNWTDTLSDERTGSRAKYDLLMTRTHFDEYELEGKTILECGMGGGDDTEILLQLPFSEVHSFDLSRSVDRAARYLTDPRLTISQASIFDIPYADESFDFVFCHRVLQHTPDPLAALRSICRKVRPGGILFAHCYKRSLLAMMNYKYKLRWLTRHLPLRYIKWYVDTFGAFFHRINHALAPVHPAVRGLTWNFIPFDYTPAYGTYSNAQILALEQLNTFDALTPRFDLPLTTREFVTCIEAEGFDIQHLHDPRTSPLLATAVRAR
jgi:SAM-dependent methyltransferase